MNSEEIRELIDAAVLLNEAVHQGRLTCQTPEELAAQRARTERLRCYHLVLGAYPLAGKS